MRPKTNQDTTVVRKHKSISLTKQEWRALKAKVSAFPSQEVAAENIGLANRDTLARVLKFGSGAQATVDTIRRFLTAA